MPLTEWKVPRADDESNSVRLVDDVALAWLELIGRWHLIVARMESIGMGIKRADSLGIQRSEIRCNLKNVWLQLIRRERLTLARDDGVPPPMQHSTEFQYLFARTYAIALGDGLGSTMT